MMSFKSPIVRDSFHFLDGAFSAITSTGAIHQRRTAAELEAHFLKGLLASNSPTGIKDHPAHWYEAQLLHYGLPVSRIKGTAKCRLMSAVLRNPAGLAVPAHIEMLEKEMEAEWDALRKRNTAENKEKAESGKKRRSGDDSDDININISIGETIAKKIKISHDDVNDRRGKSAQHDTNRHDRILSNSTYSGYPNRGDEYGSSQTFQDQAFVSRYDTMSPPGQKSPPFSSVPGLVETYNEPPPPYPGSPQCHDSFDDHRTFSRPSQGQQRLPPLGLINGRYEIISLELPGDRGMLGKGEKGMVCTIDGTALWVSFDLGFVNGVMYTPERPRRSSLTPIVFEWCGVSRLYGQAYGPHHRCTLAFTGSGLVIGSLFWGDREWGFQARRIDGMSSRSEVSAREMLIQWERYRQD